MTEPHPLDRSIALRGRELRHAAIALLHRRGPMSIGDLVSDLRRAGFEIAGTANKALSDALRWEVGLGRVRRVGWGRYCIARLASTTRWRIMRRWHEATGRFDHTAPVRTIATGSGAWSWRQWREGDGAGGRLDRWAETCARVCSAGDELVYR